MAHCLQKAREYDRLQAHSVEGHVCIEDGFRKSSSILRNTYISIITLLFSVDKSSDVQKKRQDATRSGYYFCFYWHSTEYT
jgi:hypothetical protein